MIKPNRRIFLQGLGGAVVAAPFLSSLFERSAKAKSLMPKRTIVMFTHYGCITNKWFPAKLDGELTADDLLPTSLAALAPHAKKLLIPRGIRTMNEWTQHNKGPGHGRGQGNDMHTQSVGSLLTCQPITPNSDDPFSFNTATKFSAMPIGPSLDHVVAQQLSPQGEPLLLNTAGFLKESPQSALSYSAREKLFSASSATQAFSNLTGLFKPDTPMNGDAWSIAKGKAIADIVKTDLDRLRSRNMSKADKEKLAAWTELVNQVGKTIGASAARCSQELAIELGASSALGMGEGDALTRKVNDSMDNADLHSAIATLTAACNANPVIVLKYPASFVFSGLGINSDSDLQAHRVSSSVVQGPCAPNVVENLLKIDGYYAQKFANLVKMLDSISEDAGTLLDNSVAFWISDASDGCARNLNNSPIIQAGGGGGYFKTGRIVHLDAASGATAQQMLGRSLATCTDGTPQEADGINQVTGTEPQYGNAPINKYFCNIMNAMGLQADKNGYPALNGPEAEVTRFGYSDLTEDFCGGEGAVPGATIHDPGGFAALKA